MIAMALACGSPKLLIADEPTTALDVTIQAQILELFMKLQQKIGMSVILITHDLGIVAEVANRVAVMYAGSIVETAAVGELFHEPLHPYTRGLLRSLPRRGKDRQKETLYSIPGTVPDLLKLKSGCKFFDRCAYAVAEICLGSEPVLEKVKNGHEVRCRRVGDITREESAG
jgi:peptide/nickel transport system ATP-binding protein/oligopeptide transport system ATP-binding protein